MSKKRLWLSISGVVQSVGFRPFVYRLATELQLTGWVQNTARGVSIEVEGTQEQLTTFQHRLTSEQPPNAQIHTLTTQWREPAYDTSFILKSSDISAVTSFNVLPDLATCPDCCCELLDPRDRRYQYPFINCTNCGPRYTIIESLPYDRNRTTMRIFPMCDDCQSEYIDPTDRRFHAQPNACPNCGPQLRLLDEGGNCQAQGGLAWQEAAQAITKGAIVALKGLGGFQLLVDAQNQEAVRRLRQRKRRPDKPFALLYPNIDSLKLDCQVTHLETELLQSVAAPIVLLRAHKNPHFPCSAIAPNCPTLGAMLPYTPLHHLLMSQLSFPVVATSGNLSDEPICIDEEEALERLGEIADLFLVHNRPIVQPLDDSVVRVMGGRSVILRRARGYAPLPLLIKDTGGTSRVIAYGSQEKNTIAFAMGNTIAVSGHIGDLETVAAYQHFERVMKHLGELYLFCPESKDLPRVVIACDAHRDYVSTHFAQQEAQNLHLPLFPVQHHYAHVLSCMADNGLTPPVLGVAWDGTGYGPDGTIWGGEFLRISENSPQGWERVAYLRPFLLPGGEKSVREPRRTALGVLWECLGEEALWKQTDLAPLQAFTPSEGNILKSMLIRVY